jgi:predicted RNase H-like HicB family nuclease
MKYGIVLEEAPDGSVGAYLPDMAGVGVVGCNNLEALQLLRQAVRWHVEAMIEDGTALPEASEGVFDDYLELGRTFIQRLGDERLAGIVLVPSQDSAPFVSVRSHVSTFRVNTPVSDAPIPA